MKTTEVALAAAALRLFELEFVKNDQFTFAFAQDYSLARSKSYIAHVEGQVRVMRSNNDVVDVKKPGDTTGTAPGFALPQRPHVGRMTYRVLTDKYRYYCLSRQDGAAIKVKDIRPVAGDTYIVPAGHVAVRVMGGAVQSFDAGQPVHVVLDDTLLLEVEL